MPRGGVSSNAPLAELEQAVITASSVESERALLEELQADLEHEREIAGWKIIGSARSGYTNEQLTTDTRKEYYPTQISAGLTHPLFGKFKDEQSQLLELEAGAENGRLKVAIRRLDALEQLRLSYIVLWGVEQKILLADAFLSTRQEDLGVLEKRKDAGHLLASDYFEFITAQDRVERERRVNHNAAERARDIIQMLTHIRVASPLIYVPDLPVSCEDSEGVLAALDQTPEILLYQNLVDLELKKQRYSRNDIKGDVTVRGFAATSEEINTEFGYGATVSVDVAMPLNPFAADSGSRVVAQKRLQRYQQELMTKTEELKLSMMERVRDLDSERSRKKDNLSQLQAATELLREKTLRINRIDGDVLEQYQRARYLYYRAATDFVDGEVRLLQSAAQVLRFCPEGGARQSLVAENTSVIRPLADASPGKTSGGSKQKSLALPPQDTTARSVVYWWNTTSLFDYPFPFADFKQQSIDHVLVSLNAGQLAYIATPEGQAKMRRLLADGQQQGLTVSLLLGEPTWILPEFRHRLMNILQLANNFDFAGVHLDMEPSQLDAGKYGLEYLAAQLLRTVQVATEVSEHPIEISIHPRMLDTTQTNICFGCGLSNLPLNRVVVMIYRTEMQAAADQMARFSKEFPGIKFAIAQSVETSLGPENSYAHQGLKSFTQVRQRFMGKDYKSGWHGDVYIQDWQSYRQLLNSSATH
ncbi:TolC family protein [Desulfopila sp. IMCC35006]|uniref:TolC family protein n=1 Tax=Desulfopila sp. IMCC35006 TaxID=2569542 RepID=UPI0010AB970E|nr:TolC family protein [Desulfopila sp. IMCC35006]TKB26884.1 TolC family protein [Desulfopila sp. IMCC35006]